jgi:hypothetical protein
MTLKDPAMQAFAELFQQYADQRGVKDADLKPLFPGDSEVVISNWRRGRTAVPLAAVPIISRALGMGGERVGQDDLTFVFQRMGLLGELKTDGIARTAYHLQRVELRLQRLKNELGQLDRSSGVARLVRIARESGVWLAAVSPVVAGPRECRMHVEDRIDLRRVDGAPTDNGAVFEDLVWHEALRLTHAIPSKHRTSWAGGDSGTAKWTISHARTPTLPHVRMPHPALPSLCVYGINIDSGANEVAKLVSVALGYGLTLTRDEAMEQTGVARWLGATEWVPRARAHQSHLENPPRAVVWSHHAPPREGVNPDPFGGGMDAPIFWLREDDALFESYCARWNLADVDRLKAFREQLNELATRSAGVRIIDVVKARNFDEEWAQHLQVAAEILSDPAVRPALEAVRDKWPEYEAQDSDISAPFLDWLRSTMSTQ